MTFNENTDLFLEEAQELLERTEAALLELEKHPQDQELVNEVFRALHTIKGSGAMFGFKEVSEFTHSVENLFDEVRKGKVAVDPVIIDIGLRSADCISRLLTNPAGEEMHRVLLADIERLGQPSAPPPPAKLDPELQEWEIRFRPHATALQRGVRVEALLRELADLGPCHTVADCQALPLFADLDPTMVHLSWTIHLTTSARLDEIKAVFLFVEDYADLSFGPMDSAPGIPPLPAPLPAPPAPVAVPATSPVSPERETKQEAATIRVRKEKLDGLIDLVGELVILQAILELEAKKEPSGVFLTLSENLARLAADLRDTTMSIRMVPLEESFATFQRLVRDLSLQVGKELRLELSGGTTELDKNLVEALKDPLVHIIRNTADHGIEAADLRRSRGKPAVGTISIGARQVGSRVEITVADDGGGLNLEKIKERAVERKLLDPAETDQTRIQNMIFEPGFSTAEKTTGISGRGVGMDVVKSNIEKLRGEVALHSIPGKGMTITLSIPLTLVIIEGLLVKIGGSDYVVTLSQVQECVDLSAEIQVGTGGDSIINLRGRTIPIVSLRETLGIPGSVSRESSRLVIVNNDGVTAALMVDSVVGRMQVVIKPLSSSVRRIRVLSGATILGDGSVALILDVAEIIKLSSGNMKSGT